MPLPSATCSVRATLLSTTIRIIPESYRRTLVTEGSGGSGLSLRSDDLNSVGELYPEDDFRQLVMPVEATPMFLGGLGELEYHGERSLVRKRRPSPCGCEPVAAKPTPELGHRPLGSWQPKLIEAKAIELPQLERAWPMVPGKGKG